MQSKLELLEQEIKTIKELLDSPVVKDKEVEVKRFEDVRVDSAHKTYDLEVEEWLDRTDSAKTLTLN